MPVQKHLRAVQTALCRLAKSDTPIKRRNALRALERAQKALTAAALAKYPKLRKDGTAIVRRKQKGVRCPVCSVPMKSFAMLAKHIWNNHETATDHTCFCGKRLNSSTHLAKHLASIKDLQVHWGLTQLKRSAGLAFVKGK